MLALDQGRQSTQGCRIITKVALHHHKIQRPKLQNLDVSMLNPASTPICGLWNPHRSEQCYKCSCLMGTAHHRAIRRGFFHTIAAFQTLRIMWGLCLFFFLLPKAPLRLLLSKTMTGTWSAVLGAEVFSSKLFHRVFLQLGLFFNQFWKWFSGLPLFQLE